MSTVETIISQLVYTFLDIISKIAIDDLDKSCYNYVDNIDKGV